MKNAQTFFVGCFIGFLPHVGQFVNLPEYKTVFLPEVDRIFARGRPYFCPNCVYISLRL